MDVINMLRPVQDASDPAGFTRSSRSEYRDEKSGFDRTFEEVSRTRERKTEAEEVSSRRDVDERRSSESSGIREKEPVQQREKADGAMNREKADSAMKTEEEQPAAQTEPQTPSSTEETSREAPTEAKQEQTTDQNTSSEQPVADETEAQAVIDPALVQEVVPVETVSVVEVLMDMAQTQGQDANTNIDPAIQATLPEMQAAADTNVQTTPQAADAGNVAENRANAAQQEAQQALMAATAQLTAQAAQQQQQVDPTTTTQTQVTQGPSANIPDAAALTAQQTPDTKSADVQVEAAKPATDASASKELEALLKQPKTEESIVNQIKQQTPKAEGLAQIRLQPSELGEIRIEKTIQDGKPTLQISASESLVRNTLEKSTQQLKSIFNGMNVNVIDFHGAKGGNATATGGDLGNDGFNSLSFASEMHKAGHTSETHNTGTFAARMESALGDRYGIRNLHEHILDQLRIRMDNAKNEARIRLHPPELGEIKIHMTMEDRGVTVRMEANETLTRQLLERDLQQLKDTLAEAGIDVGRFDIGSGRDSSQQQYRANASGGHASGFEAVTGVESDTRNGLDTPQGAVRMNPGGSDVDYLVY